MTTTTAIENILGRLEGVTERGDGFQALCPGHQDDKASLSIGSGKDGCVLLHCQAGCETKHLLSAIGLTMSALYPTKTLAARRSPGRIVAEYDYRDPDGHLLYQALRFEPKDFRQRAPTGDGEWAWKLNGVQRVLYRLPELLASDPKLGVFVTEGEKDVDRLRSIGRIATCNVGGAGKWRPEYSESLRGRNVVILPDNDDPGRRHAQQVAESLYGIAQSIRILALPGLPEKGDVSDWLDAGGTAEKLLELVRFTPLWEPGHEEVEASGQSGSASEANDPWHRSVKNAPKIDAGTGDLAATTDRAWEVLTEANNPPWIFQYGGKIVRQAADEEDTPILEELTPQRMRHELAKITEFFQWRGAGDNCTQKPVHPPKDVVENMLATTAPPVPPIVRIAECPTFSVNGELLASPGYSAKMRVLYQPPRGFVLPAIPRNPIADEVDAARGLLLDELLGDFPFAGDAERAHALALLLQPFVRNVIEGPTPLYMVEKPSPGTGASLFVDSVLYVGSGRNPAVMAEAGNDDEWRKRIISKLSSGASTIVIDNVRRTLDSGALSAAITAYPLFEDRLLSTNTIVRAPVRCTWVGTANNPSYSNEISRRIIRIRLDAKCDRPWLRETFQIPNLRDWTREKRPELVAAALTLIRAWFAAGKPKGKRTLGMFESWAATLGGILEVANVPGFLGNINEVYDVADDEGTKWRTFFGLWHEEHTDSLVTVADLYPAAISVGMPMGNGHEQSQKIKLGKQIKSQRERVYAIQPNAGDETDAAKVSVRLIDSGQKRKGAALWRLETLKPGGVDEKMSAETQLSP